MTQIETLIERIQPLDLEAMEAAAARQNMLTKPAGSLGKLETISIRLAGIYGRTDFSLTDKVFTVMAGDHGVVDEGVSAFPQAVTVQMVANILHGGAAISVLARHVGARVVVVDMGVAGDCGDHPDLIVHHIAPGTRNFVQGPAMTREQANEAILAGVSVVETQLALGMDVLGTGDMGIGNTTPSAAIAAAFTGQDPAEIVGRGTGVDDDGLARKIDAVRRGLAVNRPDPNDALDVLTKVGGFEIAGLAGAILATAANGHPIVVDGFISTAAAMIAVGLAPQVRDYLFAAHHSMERGHGIMLEWLQLEPLLDLDLRLGEGTGGALAMSILEASGKILNEMATFADAGVSGQEE